MNSLIKRKYCYCQSPQSYEVSGCSTCKGNNVMWSEYEKHLWCFDCKIDFIPEFEGIFGGPIPVELCKVLGISFDRIEIETGKLIKMENKEEWEKTFD